MLPPLPRVQRSKVIASLPKATVVDTSYLVLSVAGLEHDSSSHVKEAVEGCSVPL